MRSERAVWRFQRFSAEHIFAFLTVSVFGGQRFFFALGGFSDNFFSAEFFFFGGGALYDSNSACFALSVFRAEHFQLCALLALFFCCVCNVERVGR